MIPSLIVSMKFDRKQVLKRLTRVSFKKAARRWMMATAISLEHKVKSRVPTDTGNLKARIHHQTVVTANNFIARVGTNVYYAQFQEFGTGMFGPKKQRVYPQTATFLSWMDKKSGTRIFARSTKGVHPIRFFSRGLKAEQLPAERRLDREMAKEAK